MNDGWKPFHPLLLFALHHFRCAVRSTLSSSAAPPATTQETGRYAAVYLTMLPSTGGKKISNKLGELLGTLFSPIWSVKQSSRVHRAASNLHKELNHFYKLGSFGNKSVML